MSICSRSRFPIILANPPTVSVVRNVTSRRRNSPALTSTSSSASVTDTSGTAFGLICPSATSAKVNVAVNVPNSSGVLSVRSSTRSSRGD
jgi:hypothetical protein